MEYLDIAVNDKVVYLTRGYTMSIPCFDASLLQKNCQSVFKFQVVGIGFAERFSQLGVLPEKIQSLIQITDSFVLIADSFGQEGRLFTSV